MRSADRSTQAEAVCWKLEIRSNPDGDARLSCGSRSAGHPARWSGSCRVTDWKRRQQDSDLRQLPDQRSWRQDPCFNREWVEGLQNENQLDVLEAIVRASLERKESRGAIYRSDYPEVNDDTGLYNQILRREGAEWKLEKHPVEAVYASLPKGVRRYGVKPVVGGAAAGEDVQ